MTSDIRPRAREEEPLERRRPKLALCLALAWAVASIAVFAWLPVPRAVPHPMITTPFYHRALLAMREGEVVIATQLSFDRMDSLMELVWRWQGPVSAVLYLSPDATAAGVTLTQLDALLLEVEELRQFVDLHLVQEEGISAEDAFGLYPANLLRNVAVFHARSDAVLCVDVDFVPDQHLRRVLHGAPAALEAARSLNRRLALVIPTVEVDDSVVAEEGIPFELARVQALYRRGSANVALYRSRMAAQEGAYLERWAVTEAEGRYAIDYQFLFEANVVVDRRDSPWYDERFRGFMPDRCAHLYEMAALGYELEVAQGTFAVLAAHEPSLWATKERSDHFHWMTFLALMREMEAKHRYRADVPPDFQVRHCLHNPNCVRFWEWL